MSDESDKCSCCGRLTFEGVRKSSERYKENPIHGTDLKKPMSEVIRDIRRQLSKARGSISDFQFAYPHWKERTEHVEGLLTCGLVALHATLLELEQFEREEKKAILAEKLKGI